MEKEQEQRVFDLTEDELYDFFQTQQKIHMLEEYQILNADLLNRVRRVLDLKDIMKEETSNHKRMKKAINKYAKQYKKEEYVKNLLKRLKKEEDVIAIKYISSVMDLMKIVYKVLNTFSFERDLPALEKYYEFEMEDMVLVNHVIKQLENIDSADIIEYEILCALNLAVEQYVSCIENDVNYMSLFDNKFPYVDIVKEEEKADE